MPVEQANNFLPPSQDILDTFIVARMSHFLIGDTLEKIRRADSERLELALQDYLRSGVAFFANRGPGVLQESGTTVWQALETQRAVVRSTPRIRISLSLAGFSQDWLNENIPDDDIPRVLFLSSPRGIELTEEALVLLPPQFIVDANVNPVDTLGSVSWICSEVRDMVNGRLAVDQHAMTARALASRAQFLLFAKQTLPQLEYTQAGLDILNQYPQGIDSLPSGFWYHGSAMTGSSRPESN